MAASHPLFATNRLRAFMFFSPNFWATGMEKPLHTPLVVSGLTAEGEDLDLTDETGYPALQGVFMRCGDADGDGFVRVSDRDLLYAGAVDLDGDGVFRQADLDILTDSLSYGGGAKQIDQGGDARANE